MDGEDKAEIKDVKGFLMGKEEWTRAIEEALRRLKKDIKMLPYAFAHGSGMLSSRKD